jgi:predicted secreted protein
VVALLAGCSREIKYYVNPEESINTKVNHEFIIVKSFDVNSIYMWREYYDENTIELMKRSIEVGEQNKQNNNEGALAQHFRFKALKKGNTEITLLYSRLTLAGPRIGKEEVFNVNIE